MPGKPEYIVVIGASAGGLNTMIELVGQLNPAINAAFFVVLHLSSKSISGYLAHRLQAHTDLKCIIAMDTLPLRRGYLYVAVPNYHLLIGEEEISLGHGPVENRWRPSIDVMFRSAAANHSTRTIGIVLTGMLDDGTSGMSAIKRSGGITIVQDPNEAEFPDMPLSVISNVDVDHCVSVSEMGALLSELTSLPPPEKQEAPADISAEAKMNERMTTAIAESLTLADKTVFTCPDCGGVLFKHEQDRIERYKCHTGHSYTERDLFLKQSEETEASLWYAIRSLEQRKLMLESIAKKYTATGSKRIAGEYKKTVSEMETHINHLKNVLMANLEMPSDTG
jgi:two-component system, chemotaxis family, protein-glutamate methylesterase/glutaminase